MSAELVLVFALAAPLVHAALVSLLTRPPGLRDVVHIGSAILLAGAATFLVRAVGAPAPVRIALAEPLPHVQLAFAVEPLGAMMACLIAGLGVLLAIHTAGSVRAMGEKSPARMMAFIALSTAAAMGAAYSANLFTFFVCSQALTLTSFPLVAHAGDEESRKAARIYLGTLLTASIGLFLPAMVWTYAVAGTLEFKVGGVLAGHVETPAANLLLVLYVLGLAATALPPLHRWLFASTQAPFPALTAIQAVMVVPVGCLGLLKVTSYIFGAALNDAELAAQGLLILAGAAMCYAALIALSKQDLRERLAYAVMAQSLAVVMGALLARPQGTAAAALQVVALACAAATLLMATGAVHAATGRIQARDFHGLGRAMPWTMAGFAIGAASMIGAPPFSGAWSKFFLLLATADRGASDLGYLWAAGIIGVAAVLMFASLGPLAANALAGRAPTDPFKRPDGASIMLVAPVIMGAAATLWLLLMANPIVWYLRPMWTPP